MQKIIVAKKEMKPSARGGMMVALFDEKGTRFSGFLPELKDVQEGDTVELDIQVDGKYLNIMGAKVLSHGEAPDKPTAKPTYGQDSPEKRRSIERQAALERAVELAIAGGVTKVSSLDILREAELFYQWISQGTIPALNEAPKTVKTGEDTTQAKQAPPASKPQGETPAKITPEQVNNDIARALKENLWDLAKAQAKVRELGGTGTTMFLAIRGLKPDRLTELNKIVQELLKPIFQESDNIAH